MPYFERLVLDIGVTEMISLFFLDEFFSFIEIALLASPPFSLDQGVVTSVYV